MGKSREKQKHQKQITRASIIYWIVVFMFYAAFFGSLGSKIVTWPLWVRIVVICVVILLPVIGQIMLILSHKKRDIN